MNNVDLKEPIKGKTLLLTALAAGGLALLLVLRSNRTKDEPPAAVAPETTAAADLDAAAPPRCTRDKQTAPIGEGLARGDLLLGEGAATRDGYAIGIVRTVQGTRRTSLALLSRDLHTASFVDLAPEAGDSPPPRPFVLAGNLLAAAYGAADKNKLETRSLQIMRIDGDKAVPFADVPQQADESLAFDLVTAADGHAIVAWDEDAPDIAPPTTPAKGGEIAGHGIIKVAAVPAQGGVVTSAAVVSSPGSDVERPQGVARPGGGFWIGWIARRADPHIEREPNAIEQNGEDRGFSWVEIAKVDDQGKRVGEVHRITSDAGHVTAFDWLAGPDGKLDIFIRDDTEATQEGEGGRVLRIAVRDEGPQTALPLVKMAAGPGDPSAVGNIGQRWLFYADTGEHAHAISLLAEDTNTLEPALDGLTVLLASPENAAATGEGPPRSGDQSQTGPVLLAVGPTERGAEQAQAYIVRCNAAARH